MLHAPFGLGPTLFAFTVGAHGTRIGRKMLTSEEGGREREREECGERVEWPAHPTHTQTEPKLSKVVVDIGFQRGYIRRSSGFFVAVFKHGQNSVAICLCGNSDNTFEWGLKELNYSYAAWDRQTHTHTLTDAAI